jgi:2-polyprenyl-3-methyl-5-hydroxy-6-metoxy-1,4-benzoquinol methylase
MILLHERRRLPELMDDPHLAPQAHAHALRGLERINWWSHSARILWPPIRRLLSASGGKTLRILDIASGAGDLPIGIWRKARAAGHDVEVEGWDIHAGAVAYARESALKRGATVRFLQRDALGVLDADRYDVVMCSLFLHHLSRDQAVELLCRMASWATRLVLVNDLRRSALGLVLAHAATRLLSSSEIVHTDGPRSVAAAFSLEEVRLLSREAGLETATIARRWPFRFLLSWERK